MTIANNIHTVYNTFEAALLVVAGLAGVDVSEVIDGEATDGDWTYRVVISPTTPRAIVEVIDEDGVSLGYWGNAGVRPGVVSF